MNGKLDSIATEFCSILTSGGMDLDSDTLDAVSITGQLALGRIRVGLLLFHFCSFWRRIRRPLLRWRLLGQNVGPLWGLPARPGSPSQAEAYYSFPRWPYRLLAMLQAHPYKQCNTRQAIAAEALEVPECKCEVTLYKLRQLCSNDFDLASKTGCCDQR